MKSRGSFSRLTGYVRSLFPAAMIALALVPHTPVLAQSSPVVRVSTTLGEFSIGLFEQETPATVDNFLGYVNRGDYQRSFVHRLATNFVIQAGGYRFIPGCEDGVRPCGPVAIPQQDPVVNEPGISNTRGTVAMAKLGGDPDSATSQWFVNLDDNSEELDDQNGGFTVFGEVLGEGMDVVDRIADLQNYNLCNSANSCYANEIPLRDFGGQFPEDDNFIHINTTQVSRFSSSLHVFEPTSNQLITTVDGGAEVGVFNLRLQLLSGSPEFVFELVPDSLIPMGIDQEGEAEWDPETGRLEIPQVEVNFPGGVNVITNVVFALQSESPMRFVLESWEPAD